VRVEIADLNGRCRINKRLVERIVRRTAGRLKKFYPVAIEIAFVSDRAMRRFNRIYKKHDRFTDVLSFRIDAREFGLKNFVGQIIISADRARANAKSFGNAIGRELALYIVHGVLHLAGYNDIRPSDRVRMRMAEKKILEHICTKEDLSKVLTRR